MKLIEGQSTPEVWLKAAEYLVGQPKSEDFDVFLHVTKPTVLSQADAAVYKAVDAFLTSHGAFGVHTVAETIFPMSEYQRNGAKGLFGAFPETLRSIQRTRSDGNWGSYAYRILRQKDARGKVYSPLEDLVEKIQKHGKYRATYELGSGLPLEDDIPLYDAATDRGRIRGGPCLSHVSIKVHDGKVRLNATYRSHYYMRRLLGNLVGLGRLQYFIARETGLEVGALTINSTFACLDSGGTEDDIGGRIKKAEILELIRNCRALYAADALVAI